MYDLFILINNEIDFTTILGVYDDYLVEEDVFDNVKKYSGCYRDLELLGANKNEYYGIKNMEILKR